MTETELRQKVVDTIAEYKGVDTNHCQEIVDTYNGYHEGIGKFPRGYRLKYGDESCAATVSAVGIKCGLADIIFPEVGAWEMFNLYCAKGKVKARGTTPAAGDIIFMKPSGYHVGIVSSVEDDGVHYIAGNDNDAHECCAGCIWINSAKIVGYGIPDYAAKATTEEEVCYSSDLFLVADTLEKLAYTNYEAAKKAAYDTNKRVYSMYGELLYTPEYTVEKPLTVHNCYTPTTSLRLRAKPIIGTTLKIMQPGDLFVADGKTSGKWYHGCFNSEVEGWASSAYLMPLNK